ncbi:hypothetical protein ABPG74_020565 [Tetrahymena malaccensis]
MKSFTKIFYGALRIATAGMVNVSVDKSKIVLKDPFTGLADLIKKGSDKLFRNRNQGVWIGNRPIAEFGNEEVTFGFSSAALRAFNLDVMHQAVMVDGHVYSLSNDKGGNIQIKEVFSNYEKTKYEWRYRGESKITIQNFEQMIEQLNQHNAKYNIAYANCQDVSDALSKYALGLYSKEKSLFLIFPKAYNIGDALLYGIYSGSGAKALDRLATDISIILS